MSSWRAAAPTPVQGCADDLSLRLPCFSAALISRLNTLPTHPLILAPPQSPWHPFAALSVECVGWGLGTIKLPHPGLRPCQLPAERSPPRPCCLSGAFPSQCLLPPRQPLAHTCVSPCKATTGAKKRQVSPLARAHPCWLGPQASLHPAGSHLPAPAPMPCGPSPFSLVDYHAPFKCLCPSQNPCSLVCFASVHPRTHKHLPAQFFSSSIPPVLRQPSPAAHLVPTQQCFDSAFTQKVLLHISSVGRYRYRAPPPPPPLALFRRVMTGTQA